MSGKSPRKLAGGKKPTTLKALQSKLGSGKDKPPHLSSRPRRFSLLYSSDSSLSDIPQDGNNRGPNMSKVPMYENPKAGTKLKERFSNAMGKNGKLISPNQDSAITSGSDSATASSDYQSLSEDEGGAMAVGEDDENSDDDDDDDDDDDSDSDSDSSSTSSDDDVDFVRLTAERKKNAMKQLNALKRGKTPPEVSNNKVNGNKKNDTEGGYYSRIIQNRGRSESKDAGDDDDDDEDDDDNDDVSSSELSDAPDELSFNFKGDDGLKFGDAAVVPNKVDEDLGEEVKDKKPGKSSNSVKPNVDRLAVPKFSDSEDSDYNIDQEAYFKTIDDDDNENITGMDAGLETGDDDMAILDAEEQNMVQQLEHDEQSSFDDSQVDANGNLKASNYKDGKNRNEDDDYDYDEDDEDDGIMSDFDMPFYEDPKFSNLYYYDGSDQPLTLSTSLPLVLSEEKRKREERKQLKQRERQETLKRRLKSKNSKREHSATPEIADDEYVFGLFFQSDDEKPKVTNDLESPLRRLSTVAVSDKELSSGDEEYEDILLDIAHLPTDEEDENDLEIDEEDNIDAEEDLEDDDDISVTNVFIDIDDLDPDGFYFHYDSLSDEENGENKSYPDTPDDHVEGVVFVDDESTDEDDTLPPPNTRRKIGTKAKEVVSANVVGLKPPKLGTWQTDNKPFSIIDGLSTKSLYPTIPPVQQIVDPRVEAGEVSPHSGFNSGGEKEELTLNELLNMSELEDENEEDGIEASSKNKEIGTWYHKPSVPLSAFRNKGINFEHQEDEFMLPVFSARKFPIGYVGSERTRRKIDKMKEFQRKKDEKRRKLKKKKKLLKIRREKQRIEKQKSHTSPDDDADPKIDSLNAQTPSSVNLASPSSSIFTDVDGGNTPNDFNGLVLPTRKNSVKGLGMDDIDELLKSDDDLMLSQHRDEDGDIDLLGSDDADLLVSLAAPINEVEFDQETMSNVAAWRRRNSIAEAAAENMRVTKNGLFSETALADLEEIIGGSTELPS